MRAPPHPPHVTLNFNPPRPRGMQAALDSPAGRALGHDLRRLLLSGTLTAHVRAAPSPPPKNRLPSLEPRVPRVARLRLRLRPGPTAAAAAAAGSAAVAERAPPPPAGAHTCSPPPGTPSPPTC